MYQNGMKNYKQETVRGAIIDVTYNAQNTEKKDGELLQRLVFEKGNVDILDPASKQTFFFIIQHSCLQMGRN